jgi:hypothetical protein
MERLVAASGGIEVLTGLPKDKHRQPVRSTAPGHQRGRDRRHDWLTPSVAATVDRQWAEEH